MRRGHDLPADRCRPSPIFSGSCGAAGFAERGKNRFEFCFSRLSRPISALFCSILVKCGS